MNNQADDSRDNATQPDLPSQTGTHLLTNRLPTPTSSKASQVPPNITAYAADSKVDFIKSIIIVITFISLASFTTKLCSWMTP
jgi:hypothetical protein